MVVHTSVEPALGREGRMKAVQQPLWPYGKSEVSQEYMRPCLHPTPPLKKFTEI